MLPDEKSTVNMKQHLNQHLGTSLNTDEVPHKKENKKR